MEQWKSLDIVNCPHYEVSDQGRIRRKSTQRIVDSWPNEKGYYRIRLRRADGRFQSFRVHRLVAIAFIDNPDNKPEVDHINSIKSDNCARNLRWVTRLENVHYYLSKKCSYDSKKSCISLF